MWPEKIAKCLWKLPKLISLEKWWIFNTFTKITYNVGDLDKLFVAKGFKKLPKVQLIAKSGHTDSKMMNLHTHKSYKEIFIGQLNGLAV